MLIITDMRARLRGSDSRIVSLVMDFERLKDAPLTRDQRTQVEAIIDRLNSARYDLGYLIELTPAYEPPTLHHEDDHE